VCFPVLYLSGEFCLSSCEQLLTHLSVPDENFECLKVKAKVDYMGMLQDGKSPHSVSFALI